MFKRIKFYIPILLLLFFIELCSEEIHVVKSVSYEIIHWEDPSNNQNKWKASFVIEDGSRFSFQAPENVSSDEFPTEVIQKGSQLSILKERRAVDNLQQSWFTFENLSNGKQFKAAGAARNELPQLTGEDIYHVSYAGIEKENETFVLKFFLVGLLGEIPFTMETNDVQQDYFDTLPIQLLRELEPTEVPGGYYQRQFAVFHPLLNEEVILLTSLMGGPRQYVLSDAKTVKTRGMPNSTMAAEWKTELFIEYAGRKIKFTQLGDWEKHGIFYRPDPYGNTLSSNARTYDHLGLPNDRIQIISETPTDHKKQRARFRIKNLRTGIVFDNYEGPRLNLDP